MTKMAKLSARLRKEWFLLALVGAVLLASILPDLGRSGGWLRLEIVSNWGVALVFFLTGLGLSAAALRDGALKWRVHLLVQLSTYLLFPLLWWGFMALFSRWLPHDLALGFAYLCALPSTISSSVAMTVLARGNVPAAIFNASASSLLGIVLTPALVTLMAGTSGAALPFGQAVWKLTQLLLLPLLAGQLLRPLLLGFYQRHKSSITLVDRWVIILLVLSAFSDSVASGLWRDHGAGLLVKAAAGAAFFLVVVVVLSRTVARLMGLSVEDEIAAVFCGSKKTLASGVPMAKLLFGANPALGVIVLPIMFYHQLQLILCSWLAQRYAARERPATLGADTGANQAARQGSST
ncbi:solute carrier family 10 (sodium/bile acid cotransporter), member 7 [Roseateles sp. YR242]|uniref:bile acid:sodium symporter family protein n=1 Tax=Roseateles sp. YR242 TaxID=1855305 RepID=UPI0008BC7E82|nr:bile acid:sodium symporter family protein [Roseateles sp. YR242]SEL44222.1 solute carrier family 10 (sodium/bile acid cotransporter), member 7 [Roseateles sp. YR242]